MDANRWWRILALNSFGADNHNLLKAFTNIVKKLNLNLIETQTIEAFLSCRLIPPDKDPGLKPIGVGEVLRKIAGKVKISVLKNYIINCTGSWQICVAREAGIEEAVHSLNSICNDENNDSVLLVNASNALNFLNHEIFPHSISFICPTIFVFIKICYNCPSRLIILGGKKLKSNESITLGNPVSMAIYGIGVTTLIKMLVNIAVTLQKTKLVC